MYICIYLPARDIADVLPVLHRLHVEVEVEDLELASQQTLGDAHDDLAVLLLDDVLDDPLLHVHLLQGLRHVQLDVVLVPVDRVQVLEHVRVVLEALPPVRDKNLYTTTNKCLQSLLKTYIYIYIYIQYSKQLVYMYKS